MTFDPNFLVERQQVDAWIASELEVAMSESDYGSALDAHWRATSPTVGEFLAENFRNIPGGDSPYNAALTDALRSGDGSSYYKALLMQALVLVQAADRAQSGQANERVRITFLPSNTRYAAMYEPHMVKGWSVIGIDWGMLCAVMTTAALVSHCVQGHYDPATQAMQWTLSPESAVAAFDANPDLKAMWVNGLTPAIIPSLPPIAPTFGGEPHQTVFGLMVLKAMIFGLVAHEYGHVMRNHWRDRRRANELRFQIEHEADGLSVLLAMRDPWKVLARNESEYNPQERTFTVAGCLLLQSMLKQLQIGDRMVDDLTGRKPRASTHPDPMDRMEGLRQIMDLLVPQNTVQRREIDMYAWFLINFFDAVWNRSTSALFLHLQRQDALGVRPIEAAPGANLRFL